MNIVVRGANWIGDAVMTIPALRRLRQLHPDATITLHTRPWAEGVFRDADFIDAVLPINSRSSRLGSVLDQVRQLRRGNFDQAVLFPNSFESALVARLSAIPKRLGYAADNRGFLLTDNRTVPSWKGERHESNYYLNLIDPVGDGVASALSSDAFLPVSDARKGVARQLIAKQVGSMTGPVIGFGAGSTNSLAKRWPVKRFAALANQLMLNANAKVLLMGAANESDVSDALKASVTSEVFDLTGATDLAEATAILSVLDLFVSNDMGLAHIAAAVGTPTIVIFGPTNEITTRPLGKRVEIIREPVECSPCMLRVCPIDHRCMTRITPGRVFESAMRMLETRTG